MVIPTRKEAGLLNVYSDYYSSKTAVDAYRILHSGLEQYFSSRYNLSGQEKAKSDLADKHDKLGRKLYMKGCGRFLDFQIEGFANKEQSSKQLSDMVQTLVNKAAMSSTCSAALACQCKVEMSHFVQSRDVTFMLRM
jgi:hypothetical protein